MQFLSAAFVLLVLPFINAIPTSADTDCPGKKTVESSLIGPGKNVSAEYYSCAVGPSDGKAPAIKAAVDTSLTTDVCGLQCDTTCYSGTGGPNPTDCQVIADALLYESQNTTSGNNVTVGASGANLTNYLTMSYASCKSTLVNQDATNITYCRTDWAGVTGYIGQNCQSTQSANGGICVETQQQFFVEVDHS